MKKIVFFLACAAFFSTQTFAQSEREDFKTRFGFQFSPSWSVLGSSDKLIESVRPNWGAKFGVMAEYYFQPSKYALISGLGFGFNQGGTIQNGYDSGVFWPKSDLSAPKFDTIPKNAKLRYSATYVEIPFGLKMRGGSNEDSRISFFAEAPVFTLGFLTKVKGDITGSNGRDTNDENIREDVNGLSLAWGLGGGVEYELATNGTLVAGLFYQKQFTDFTQNGGSFKTADGTWKTDKSKSTIGQVTLKVGVFF